METKIWEYQRWVNIAPTETVNSTRRLHSFCAFNCLRDVIFKSQGGYYLLSSEGTLTFVGRALNNITFETIYNILSNEKQ